MKNYKCSNIKVTVWARNPSKYVCFYTGRKRFNELEARFYNTELTFDVCDYGTYIFPPSYFTHIRYSELTNKQREIYDHYSSQYR